MSGLLKPYPFCGAAGEGVLMQSDHEVAPKNSDRDIAHAGRGEGTYVASMASAK